MSRGHKVEPNGTFETETSNVEIIKFTGWH